MCSVQQRNDRGLWRKEGLETGTGGEMAGIVLKNGGSKTRKYKVKLH
jgi:hypothetical protein